MRIPNVCLIFLFVVAFTNVLLPAQSQAVWIQRYDDATNYIDVAKAIAVDSSGNSYVTGYSYNGTTDFDYVTIKYNSSGTQQWIATYDGPASGDDEACAIAVDSSGNCYVTGYSTGTSTTGIDFATVKYNSSGVQQWVARYSGTGNFTDEAVGLKLDSSGNVYVAGYSANVSAGTGYDFAIIKYTSSGSQIWAALYDFGIVDDVPTAMAVDSSNNVYVTGYTINSASNHDYATVKYNSSGTFQWASSYNGPGNRDDDPTGIAVDASGNVFVTGGSYGGATTDKDYATIKYNSSGTQQWVARYCGATSTYTNNNADVATAIGIDSQGYIYVTGYSGPQAASNVSGADYATIKYDTSGNQIWVQRYLGYDPVSGLTGKDNYAYALVLDSSDNVIVTGMSYGPLIGKRQTGLDYATVKYSSAGGQQWIQRYAGGFSYALPTAYPDIPTAIAVDSSGYIYVTGYSNNGGNYSDYLTVKYNP